MRKIILCAIALFALSSCYRKPLYDTCICENYACIPISADWEPSTVEPQNVTVLVYDRATGELIKEHIYEQNNEEIQSYIYLKMGEYTAVIFNELRDQIDYMSVDGYENLSTLRFFANNDSKARARSAEGTDRYIQQPGDLAVQIVDDLDVTSELIKFTSEEVEQQTKVSIETKALSEKLLGLIPTRKTVRLHIKLHVDMIKSALMPALVDLSNVADGYMVATDKNTLNPKSMQFTMNNRTYDAASYDNGYITATLTLFGSLGDRMSTACHTAETPLKLDALFMLTDAEKTLENRSIDVTHLVSYTDHDYEGIEMWIDCCADTPLPRVEPINDGDSGFDTEIEDWDLIEVPLIL